ncbi:uncharacterized protein LOC111391357 [Olea europaea var. sylvestris]|uniref:uncharacterized protein LOC111391357 n=1 Tax=Olea europaea var. sylvestris TaxID=158386 RepID=UPI000C1D7C6B|nr:uncharacterized protein LOC111391357 [Olea europaea var. sylvestris]
MCIGTNKTNKEINEILAYQSARWISPPKAMCRIFSFNLCEIHPPVYSLQLHIEDNQQITYNDHDDLSTILWNENTKRTMLTEFFYMNEINEFARTLGPTSFNDLRTVNGLTVATYRKAALLHALLSGDNHCEEYLSEAILYEMPTSLRRLFTTLLTLSNANNPKLLWDKFRICMIDDYVHENISVEAAEVRALEDTISILETLGKNINDYGMVSFNVSIDENERLKRMIEYETIHFDVEEDIASTSRLNKEQQFAYDMIMERVKSKSSGAFFIDDPSSSGVSASLLPGGRTAHSRFKIPLEIGGEISCYVSKQSALRNLLKISRLIIWDEAPMIHRCAIETVDKMLRDITNCNLLFGGKVIVLGGDFRQVLPVVPKGKKEDIMKAILVYSYLWPLYFHLSVVKNMRAKFDPTFCHYLLRIGDGTEQEHTCRCIKLPDNIVLPLEEEITSLKELIHHVFPNIEAYADNLDTMANRVILTPTNECVDHINRILLEQIPGQLYTYYSFDEAIDKSKQSVQKDFLNSLTSNDSPPHELKLKVNCPVMLLRNINPSEGLCNRTRLTCRKFEKNVILAEIISGEYCGK